MKIKKLIPNQQKLKKAQELRSEAERLEQEANRSLYKQNREKIIEELKRRAQLVKDVYRVTISDYDINIHKKKALYITEEEAYRFDCNAIINPETKEAYMCGAYRDTCDYWDNGIKNATLFIDGTEKNTKLNRMTLYNGYKENSERYFSSKEKLQEFIQKIRSQIIKQLNSAK